MHHVAVALHIELLRHAHRARFGHAAHIVAAQIEQHHVLRDLLLVVAQLLLERAILRIRLPPPPRARDRVRRHLAVLHDHQQLRRGAHDLVVVHLQVVGVGRGIHGAQRAVDVERMHKRLAREALRVDALDDVALDDVVDDPLHVGEVRLALHIGAHRRAVIGRLGRVDRRRRLAVLQPLDQLVDPKLRLAVGRFDVAVQPRVADHANHVLEMVEDQHGIDELKQRLGQAVRVALGGRHARLEVANRLVRQVAHRAAAERRQIGAGDQRKAVQLLLDQPQRVLAAARRRAQHAVRLGADERVAPRPLAALDRFEQERVGPALDLEKGGDGRFEVGQHFAVDRREVALAARGEGFEFVKRRAMIAGGGHRSAPGRFSGARCAAGVGVYGRTRRQPPSPPEVRCRASSRRLGSKRATVCPARVIATPLEKVTEWLATVNQPRRTRSKSRACPETVYTSPNCPLSRHRRPGPPTPS